MAWGVLDQGDLRFLGCPPPARDHEAGGAVRVLWMGEHRGRVHSAGLRPAPRERAGAGNGLGGFTRAKLKIGQRLVIAGGIAAHLHDERVAHVKEREQLAATPMRRATSLRPMRT